MTTATAPQVSREVLEDRWRSATYDVEGTYTDLAAQLSDTLHDLVMHVAYCPDVEVLDTKIIDELFEQIRETVVARVDELGLTR